MAKKITKKCIVMFSGGLDSRLAIKIMQQQGFKVVPSFFKLPFGTGCCNENCCFNFSQVNGVKLKVFDCTKGELLKQYLNVIHEAKNGRGAGINPCIDCRIFIFRKAKQFADKEKINLIVSGEVLGERPMSQMKHSMELIEEESGLKGRLLRPLSAKFLDETNSEKQKFVNREELYEIFGRGRKKQIALAKKFKIKYPNPAGGCLLCEKKLKKRFEFLFERGLNEKEINLVGVGRHFIVDGNGNGLKSWVIIGRDETENKILEKSRIGELISPQFIGPSGLILDKFDQKIKDKVYEILKAYSKQGSLEYRKKFDSYKI